MTITSFEIDRQQHKLIMKISQLTSNRKRMRFRVKYPSVQWQDIIISKYQIQILEEFSK